MIKYAIFEKFPKSMKKYESMPSGNPGPFMGVKKQVRLILK